jgi:NAD(P)H-quinone oxidoreductase subunit 5
MSSGAVILTTTSQDLTEMGGLGSRMPATRTAFLIGAATLIACPPLAGFWVMLQLAETYWIEQPWLVGILLLVNTLTVLNLARVFRLVFAGDPQPKTRRAPEVAWPMALPLVSVTIFALLLPWLLYQVGLVPGWAYLFAPIGEDPLQKLILLAVIPSLLVSSTLVGLVIGGNMNLSRTWARSIQTPVKFLQDLLSYDFYVDRLYQVTVVALFNQGARLLDWIDRYIVDGLVNFFSLASVFGGETLKYTTSGRSQLYLLTILLGLVLVSLLMIFRFQLI